MSFAQEIKDFLGAATSTYKLLDDSRYNKIKRAYQQAMTDELNSPTRKAQQEASLAATRESTRATKLANDDPLRDEKNKAAIEDYRAGAAYKRSLAGFRDAQTKALTNPPPPPPPPPPAPDIPAVPAPPLTTATPPAVGPVSALEPDQDDVPTNFAAAGGLVDDEDDDDEDIAPVPAVGAAPTSTDISAQSRGPAKIGLEASHDAVVGGMKTLAAQLGPQGAVPSPARQRAIQAYISGAGGATPEEMQSVYKKVDPEGKLNPTARNLAALGAIWQFKMAKNDLAGAQSAAAAMLQHYRVLSTKYGAIAAAAAENGDPTGAAKAAMAAYSTVPDGNDLKVIPTQDGRYQYQITDVKTGKPVTGGILSPQEFAAKTMGFATGNGFDQALLAAAGAREATKKAVGGDKPPKGPSAPKQSDLKLMREGIDNAVEDLAKKQKEGTIKDSEISALKNSAYHVLQENPTLGHDEAVNSVLSFIKAPSSAKGETDAFSVSRDKETGLNRIRFNDTGREISLSDAEYRPLVVMRGKLMKERAEKPEGGKSYGDLAADAGNAIAGMAGSMKDATLGPIAPAAEKFKAGDPRAMVDAVTGIPRRAVGAVVNPAINVGKRAIGAIGNALPNNPDDVPGVDNPL